MQNDSGQTWAAGAIVNGHVLTAGAGWVRLNAQANPAGPWRPGDVVNGHAYTGVGWVELPGAWQPDPTGRHQFRWWTGRSWGQHTLTNGLRFNDPMAPAVRPPPIPPPAPAPIVPPAPARAPLGFWDLIGKVAVGVYCGFWLLVAIYSATAAAQENEPRYLLLTSTASLNIFLYKLTGKTRAELRKGFTKAVKPKLPYFLCGALAAGGIWLSLHFDEPDILGLTVVVVAIALMFAWVFS